MRLSTTVILLSFCARGLVCHTQLAGTWQGYWAHYLRAAA